MENKTFLGIGITKSGGSGNISGLAKEDGMISAIPKNKAEELVEIIRNGIDAKRPKRVGRISQTV